MSGWLVRRLAGGVGVRKPACVLLLLPCGASVMQGRHLCHRSLCVNVVTRWLLPGSSRPPPSASLAQLNTLAAPNGLMQCNSQQNSELREEDDLLSWVEVWGQEVGGCLALLLLLTAHRDDHTTTARLLQQARASGVRPSSNTMENVLRTYIRRDHVKAATSVYSSIKTEYPESTLQGCTVLHLCVLLVENGQCSEAMQILREFIEAGSRPEVPPKHAAERCRLLLSKASQAGGYEAGKEMLDLLLLGGLAHPGPQVLAPLLQCRLDSGDLPGTVEVAEYIYSTFNTLPKRMEIFLRLMQDKPPSQQDLVPLLARGSGESGEEPSLLARMFDLTQRCYGPTQALHDLLFACLESALPGAARLVLQTLADQTDGRQLVRMCKLYAKNGREAALEHLLAASEGMTYIDRQKIHEILLDAYRLSGKVVEETPSPRTSMQD